MTLTDEERVRFAAYCRERAKENGSVVEIVGYSSVQHMLASRAVAYAMVADDIDSSESVRIDSEETEGGV